MQDMNRHQPWVMKDPRMALAMPLWRPLIPDLVCVIVHKDPIKNSISLASNGKKSSQSGDSDMMTPQRWLNLWGSTIKQGLLGCKGAPTVVFDSRLIISDVEGSLRRLKASLERAGVRGLTMPSAAEVQNEVKSYIRTGPRQYRLNKQVQARLGLEEQPQVDTTIPVMSTEQVRASQRLSIGAFLPALVPASHSDANSCSFCS